MRPVTGSGRPLTGFARPGTGNRPATSSRPGTKPGTSSIEAALRGGRPGTNRPVTSGGRCSFALNFDNTCTSFCKRTDQPSYNTFLCKHLSKAASLPAPCSFESMQGALQSIPHSGQQVQASIETTAHPYKLLYHPAGLFALVQRPCCRMVEAHSSTWTSWTCVNTLGAPA